MVLEGFCFCFCFLGSGLWSPGCGLWFALGSGLGSGLWSGLGFRLWFAGLG